MKKKLSHKNAIKLVWGVIFWEEFLILWRFKLKLWRFLKNFGGAFFGDLVGNQFFIVFLTISGRFPDGFWNPKRSREATQQQKGRKAKK